MVAAGLSVMIIGLGSIRLLMDNAGKMHGFLASIGIGAQISMALTMFGTFSPLWLGGLVGWAVGAGAGGGDTRPMVRAAAAAAMSVPIALLDPWAIVALGIGENVLLPLKLAFLSAPVLIAAYFAYSGWSDRSFAPANPLKNLLVLAAVTAAIYLIIYWLILPWGNPTAIPLVPR